VNWRDDVVTQSAFRKQLLERVAAGKSTVREVCQQLGVSEKTFYKWQARYRQWGEQGLENRSRRPLHSPKRTDAVIETRVVELRRKYPDWGARKIESLLECEQVPARSTIHDILQRYQCIDPEDSAKSRRFIRFEHKAPNDLWQMDFKGSFQMENRQVCAPLTVLDDHSRYVLAVRACANQRSELVQHHLMGLFRTYGLPVRMTMDNGAPWGSDLQHPYTRLTSWLIRLGIHVSHSRPYHPQTQGKLERFHRTLKRELLRRQRFENPQDAQHRFDSWLEIYNTIRPHEALEMRVPASRYRSSSREFPEYLAPVESYYRHDDQIRMVQRKGYISFRGHQIVISKGFSGLPVALRRTEEDDVLAVYFCNQKVKRIDLRQLEIRK